MAVTGRIGSLLELGAGFHHDFTGRDNIYLSASIYGLRKQEVDRRFDEIVEFSELERFIDLPVRTYSAGMYMRLGFSIAVNVDAESCSSTRCSRWATKRFSASASTGSSSSSEQGKTIAFVSHSGAGARAHVRSRAAPEAGSARVRRRDGRGDPPLPGAACGRRSSGRASSRAARVGQLARSRSRDVRLVGPTASRASSSAAGDPLVLHMRRWRRARKSRRRAGGRASRCGRGAARSQSEPGARRARLGRDGRRGGPVRDRAPAAC